MSTAQELFRESSLVPLFRRGLVFVQCKRPAADQLIASAAVELAPHLRFRHHDTRDLESRALRAPGPGARASPARCAVLPLVEIHGSTDGVADLVAGYKALGHRRGLWVKGHIAELPTATLCQFDALFLFHMSEGDFNHVRSSVPLGDSAAKELEDSVDASGRAYESVLCVVTSPAIGEQPLPRLTPRPTVLPLTPHDRDASLP
ncbi:hypothetical protein [Streptomyces boninensis]|uniref:hypothetical protein n=1 Tax=Streptomyces boninensis TaxID=2039455 RepID=UPI003B216E75